MRHYRAWISHASPIVVGMAVRAGHVPESSSKRVDARADRQVASWSAPARRVCRALAAVSSGEVGLPAPLRQRGLDGAGASVPLPVFVVVGIGWLSVVVRARPGPVLASAWQTSDRWRSQRHGFGSRFPVAGARPGPWFLNRLAEPRLTPAIGGEARTLSSRGLTTVGDSVQIATGQRGVGLGVGRIDPTGHEDHAGSTCRTSYERKARCLHFEFLSFRWVSLRPS